MMAATASNLDIDKFAKVRRLMTAGATEGERTAARARAEAMAQRAGMTLNQALSNMDSTLKSQPTPAGTSDWRDIFSGMDDWMEEKHPGYKAKQAEKKSAREERRAERRRLLLEQFGSVSAVFALTEIERALFVAAAPFAKRRINNDWCGTQQFAFTYQLGARASLIFSARPIQLLLQPFARVGRCPRLCLSCLLRQWGGTRCTTIGARLSMASITITSKSSRGWSCWSATCTIALRNLGTM